MIALSFRIKLLLAMMLLVAGVTGATLFITQKKVQATYSDLFQNQFETEANYFNQLQEGRLSAAKKHCLELARLPEFRTALAAGNINQIYSLSTNYLNQQNLRGGRAGRNPGGTLGLGRNNQIYFRVLNAQGEILRLPDSPGPIKAQARKRMEVQLAAVQEGMKTLEEQPVGYLAPERTNGVSELLEVIVTKVTDAEGQQTLGALLLGVPLQASEQQNEQELNAMSKGGIETGIWLDENLYSKTVNDKTREAVAKAIRRELPKSKHPQDTLNFLLPEMQRRIFLKLLNPDSPYPPAYQVSIYSLAKVYRTENELRWQVMAFGTGAIIAALILSLLIAHNLSIPLRELVKGTQAIRSGDLQVKVPVRSKDELGELAASFNEMSEGLTQKEFYRTILNMVADEKVAHALVNGQLALGGEVREITVLFCDIRGFTALTQNMPPEDVIDMLNEHMTALTRIVKEHHGVLDKFVGDLLMAIFGAPTSHENDTLNAVRCAVRLREERERLNTTSQYQLEVGIGIGTGNVVAGCMGSMDRLNYTVLGERVNLASRLCSQAEARQIVIDQTTREKLGASISSEPLAAFNLKGFNDDVVAYELKKVHSWASTQE